MNVKMKNMNIYWVDKIPVDWKIKRLKNTGNFKSGRDYKHLSDGAIPLFGSSETPFAFVNEAICNKKAVAVGRKGTIDKPFILPEKFWAVDTCLYNTVQNKSWDLEYVYYWMKIIPFRYIGSQTAIPSLTQSQVNNVFIAQPPLKKQLRIVNYLNQNCSKIDTEITLLEKKSILLDEYKNALIYETVTKGLDKNAEMKDSGVEWIGDIPSHWSIKRVCDSFNGLKKITTPGRTDVLSLTLNGVIEKDIENLKGLNPESYDTYQIFKKDNLVFKLIDLENYKTSRVGRVFKDGIMSSAYIRLEGKKNTNISYQYYQFFDLYLRGIFNSIGSNGVRSTLNRSDLLKIPSIIPPKEEQKEIVDFLDKELTAISSKIELINKKIELLKEYKQSLIYEAVTGQLEIE